MCGTMFAAHFLNLSSFFLRRYPISFALFSISFGRDYEQLNNQMLYCLRDKVEALERSMSMFYLFMSLRIFFSSRYYVQC